MKAEPWRWSDNGGVRRQRQQQQQPGALGTRGGPHHLGGMLSGHGRGTVQCDSGRPLQLPPERGRGARPGLGLRARPPRAALSLSSGGRHLTAAGSGASSPFPSAERASIRPGPPLPSLADRRRVGAAPSPQTSSCARTSRVANGSRRAPRRALGGSGRDATTGRRLLSLRAPRGRAAAHPAPTVPAHGPRATARSRPSAAAA